MYQDYAAQQLANRLVQHYGRIPRQNGSQKPIKRCLVSRLGGECVCGKRASLLTVWHVALAGGPGSGKSTLASAVADKVTQQHVKCGVISIEGFMKPKSAFSSPQEVQKRGTLESFDGDAVVEMFKTLRARGPGHELRVPAFDEEKGDPVPDAQLIEADSEAVVFEGLWLLADREPWKQIEEFVDEKWYIHVRPELTRERVASRRVQKGICRSMEEALKSYDEFDAKNAEFMDKNRYHTDIIIEANEEMAIREDDGKYLK
ncbi:uncharacterized protein LTR77_000130 [Saxophila tyrrhenica]|uniref:Phosphoribulokinase/uridine kinase domain-containing protein n=1 Tax=Saxophila tyrrhenica TaxID=1690608 RepID=A0AAV9PLU2_9PEZI|nr:hypothetical protein LTR77_000130 [Saxophila tyrrhenica]